MAQQIITWHDKHGDRHYTGNTPEEIHASALTILRERLDLDYLCHPEEADFQARDILVAEDGQAAWAFLQTRNDYEYELITVGSVH